MEDGGRRIAATGWLERADALLQSLDFELQRQVIVVVQHGRGFDEPRRASQRLELRKSGDQDGPFLAVDDRADEHVVRQAEHFRLMLLQGTGAFGPGKRGKATVRSGA